MTTIIIEDSNVQAKQLLSFIKTLPFVTVVRETVEKKSFSEAEEECNAISVDAFFDELDERIKKRFNA